MTIWTIEKGGPRGYQLLRNGEVVLSRPWFTCVDAALTHGADDDTFTPGLGVTTTTTISNYRQSRIESATACGVPVDALGRTGKVDEAALALEVQP